MNEVKTFRGVILALVFYASYEAFLSSSFVLPLPLFEVLCLLLSLYFLPQRKVKGWLYAILPVLTFLLYAFSRSFNYSIFMANEGIQDLDAGGFFDIVYLFFMLSLSVWQFFEFRLEKKSTWLFFTVPCLFFDSLFPMMGLMALVLLPQIVFLVQKKTLFQEGNSIWLYFILLEIARVLTLYFL